MAINLSTSAIILCLFLLTFLSSALNITRTAELNAYQVMEIYNFPPGLLPQGSIGYDLDKNTGKFSTYLPGACKFSLPAPSLYQIQYKSTINGYISSNRLSRLQGITVKLFIFWVNINEVTRDGDTLKFSVDFLSASFSATNFYSSPQCNNAKLRRSDI
ncbi:hypothetical protein ZOSMA_22G01410 [Zostera marina]|uniref:Uncharacterized protein n=1 Tax=Zostera marina TaxID=29655 RepID=A0A0K9PIR0_ZOSMR|nr:hypothetical protein ZOSMA_22G01410 [Zostera marina]